MNRKAVLVTGANGYIGNAVAKAFSRAGWKTFGLIRRPGDSGDLALDEITPIIGTPEDTSFLDQAGETHFDVIVSNTEDTRNPTTHFERVRQMLGVIAERSTAAGKRPLVMFTSGCKDYGKMAEKHGAPRLAAHTESSPLNPPEQLAPRKDFGVALLEATDAAFDATVLRPTIVYGHSSSHYGELFKLASQSRGALRIVGDPNAVMHSLHVDDCGDAYVALAEHVRRDEVAGRAFNISNARYETAREIGEALARAYGLALEFANADGPVPAQSAHSLANFSQWVSSERIRAVTGWAERKPTFVEGLPEFRLAYEAAMEVRKAQP